MYRLALIPGIIVTILGVLALLGGAGGASLIFIIPGVFLIIIAEKKKKKARANVIKLIMLEFKSDDISADILF